MESSYYCEAGKWESKWFANVLGMFYFKYVI